MEVRRTLNGQISEFWRNSPDFDEIQQLKFSHKVRSMRMIRQQGAAPRVCFEIHNLLEEAHAVRLSLAAASGPALREETTASCERLASAMFSRDALLS